MNEIGYHHRKIHKGVLGKPSKIQEELDELNDALEYGNKILALCELADLYGALEAVAQNLGVTMPEVRRMSDATKRAFQVGERK
jgi:hypothetical protein